jgi:hypothetical protein
MNLRSRDYAADLRRDIESLQNILRFVRGEPLDPKVKERVIADLTSIVERELYRLQHALAALSEGAYEAPEPVKQVKNVGAQARAKVRWALERLEKDVLPTLEGSKKHELERFLEHASAKRKQITSVKNRAEMKLNAPKWQALFAEIEKKEASLTTTTAPVEEKPGRRFRTAED